MAASALTVFPRGIYTATQTSSKFGNPGCQGIMLFLNVFTASGTGGLIPQLRRYDPIDPTQSKIIWGIPLPVKTTGTFDYIHRPGSSEAQASVYFVVMLPLPEQWAITMTHEDASIYEYAMTGSLVP
jgi:hypothetical protein